MSSLFKQHGWFLVVFLFYVYVTNPLNAQLPANITLGFDNHVFATMGWSWHAGSIPYRDIFDHKGPVIYLLNALGFTLHQNNLLGIYCIELIFLFLTLFFIFITLKDDLLSVCITLFALPTLYLMVFDGSEGGNMTEEYTALFAVLSVWLYVTKRPVPALRLIAYGALGALCVLTKFNMAFMPLVVFILEIYRLRKLSALIWCALGFTAVCLPFTLYFYAKDALGDFINSYILFNLTYVDHAGIPFYATIPPTIKYHPALILAMVFLLRLIYLNCSRRVFVGAVIMLVFCLLLTTGNGNLYNHYFVIFLGPFLLTAYLVKDPLRNLIDKLLAPLVALVPHTIRRLLKPQVLVPVLAVLLAVQYYGLLGNDAYQKEVEQLNSVGVYSHSKIAILDAHLKPLGIFYKVGAAPAQRMIYLPHGDDRVGSLPGISHVQGCTELADFDFVITRQHCIDDTRYEHLGQYYGAEFYRRKAGLSTTGN